MKWFLTCIFVKKNLLNEKVKYWVELSDYDFETAKLQKWVKERL